MNDKIKAALVCCNTNGNKIRNCIDCPYYEVGETQQDCTEQLINDIQEQQK